MKRTHTDKRIRASRRGESMVAVMVVLLIFFTLGAAVMTAAAATTAGSSARVSERQVYYYARSLLDTLDDTLRTGELGTLLCERAKDALLTAYAGNAETTSIQIDESTPIPITAAFSPQFDGIPLALNDAKLTYSGYADVLNTDATGAITEVSVRLQNVELSFETVYQTKYTYAMRVIYRYSGWGEKPDAAGTNWRWSGTWFVQQVG